MRVGAGCGCGDGAGSAGVGSGVSGLTTIGGVTGGVMTGLAVMVRVTGSLVASFPVASVPLAVTS